MRFTQTLIGTLAVAAVFLISFLGMASTQQEEVPLDKFDPKKLINSHVWDSHEFHIADWDGHPITLALPIILWTDAGLTVFSSAEFQHDNSGTVVVEKNGEQFVRYQEHIFYADRFDKQKFEETSTMGRPFLYDDRPLDFSITKTVFSMFFVALLLLLIFG